MKKTVRFQFDESNVATATIKGDGLNWGLSVVWQSSDGSQGHNAVPLPDMSLEEAIGAAFLVCELRYDRLIKMQKEARENLCAH